MKQETKNVIEQIVYLIVVIAVLLIAFNFKYFFNKLV